MPSLRELQSAFVGGLFDPAEGGAGAFIEANGRSPGDRFAIYRNNVFHNYREALRDVYPVVERLVGEDFFRFAADRYIPGHPSRHGNLHRFGEDFGAFLEGFAPAAGLAYLGDVARLEWHMHEAFHAADGVGMALERLARVTPERLPQLLFQLHPACRLLESPFPVHRIWLANQPDADPAETVDLADGGVRLLIRRHGYAVEMEPLGRGEFALLLAVSLGRPLQDALHQAQAAEEGFDFGAVLVKRAGDATVVDFAFAGA